MNDPYILVVDFGFSPADKYYRLISAGVAYCVLKNICKGPLIIYSAGIGIEEKLKNKKYFHLHNHNKD